MQSTDWPTPATHSSLFGRTTNERLGGASGVDVEPIQWPYGNQGAANAWVVLVGPSPGEEKRTDYPKTNPVTFVKGGDGWTPQYIGMEGFRRHAWDALIQAAFGSQYSDEVRKRLVALINLTGSSSSKEDALAREALDDGAAEVCLKIRLVHPRVVVALSNAVFDRLLEKLKGDPLDPQSQPMGPYQRPLRVFSFPDPDTGTRTLVIKPPQHPSRPMKRPGHLPVSLTSSELKTFGIRSTVNWFLSNHL